MPFTTSPQEGASEAQNRCKIISFRVSDDEYGAVEAASRRHGFKSVALFARWIVLTEKIEDPAQTPIDCDINRLWRRVEALMAALEELWGKSARFETRFRLDRAASYQRNSQQQISGE